MAAGWINQMATLIDAVIDKRLVNMGILPHQDNLQKN